MGTVLMPERTRVQRDRRGASDEVVCVLAHAFGFESAGDYGRANEATLPRLRTPRAARAARRARALAKVIAFVSRHGLAFSLHTTLEQQAQEKHAKYATATAQKPRFWSVFDSRKIRGERFNSPVINKSNFPLRVCLRSGPRADLR